MKAVLCILMALSAVATFCIVELAPEPPLATWAMWMLPTACAAGSIVLMPFVSSSEGGKVWAAALFASAAFWAAVHPLALMLQKGMYLLLVAAAALMLAAMLRHRYAGQEAAGRWGFLKPVAAAAFGLTGAIVGPLYWYAPFERLGWEHVLVIQAPLFALAFLASPWSSVDLRHLFFWRKNGVA